MSFLLETGTENLDDRNYLIFKQPGTTTEDDRYFFGQRIPSYGILDFGQMAEGTTKRIALTDAGINSQILLRSIYAFVTDTTDDKIMFRLFQGITKMVEFQFDSGIMPYQFPNGIIIDSNLSIEVEPNKAVASLRIYWQPVHVLDYFRVP